MKPWNKIKWQKACAELADAPFRNLFSPAIVLLPSESIQEAIVRQSTGNPKGFICEKCLNHASGVKCNKNIFIAFTGADLSNCHLYEPQSD